MSSALSLKGITKYYGRHPAVDHLDLEVAAGEFVTLLGPSGCGKTTTLRMIAGLERGDSGSVALGERLLTSAESGIFVQPEQRNMGMVFQSYALWPHMTVEQNVGFPLKLRKVGGEERRRRVLEVLRLVGLEGFEARGATQLSGGQQQRVALARALAVNPEVLLLDEPLSNLDAQLREQMRLELRLLQRRLHITTVFVTHDQAEAMVLSDRVVVMNRGKVEQVGSPEEVYEKPATQFVMDFLGRVNYIPAEVVTVAAGNVTVRTNGSAPIEVPYVLAEPVAPGDSVTLCVRVEDLSLGPQDGMGHWMGTIEAATYMGHRMQYLVRIGPTSIRAEGNPPDRYREGDTVAVRLAPRSVRVWPHDGAHPAPGQTPV